MTLLVVYARHLEVERARLVGQVVELREALGCAIEELERRHPLDADPLTVAIIRDGRAVLSAAGTEAPSHAELPCTRCRATPATGQSENCPECQGLVDPAAGTEAEAT